MFPENCCLSYTSGLDLDPRVPGHPLLFVGEGVAVLAGSQLVGQKSKS